MSTDEQRLSTGRCACGAVTYEVVGELRDVWDCHCDRCRRVTGHHMAATAAAREQISIAGGGTLTWWSEDGTAEYGFCDRCGSTLFWRSDATAGSWSIAAGTLDAPTRLRTTVAWWCETASDYFDMPDGIDRVPRNG